MTDQDPRPASRWLLLWVAAALSLGTLYRGAISTGSRLDDAMGERRFDAEVWREADPETSGWFESRRDLMVEDLLERGLLDGLHRSEVLELLGPPVRFGGQPLGLADAYHYVLSPGIIDAWVLLVRFGEDGRVTEARRFQS